MTFARLGVVLPLGADGDFDDGHVLLAAPILVDGRVYLYYAGRDGSKYRIGLAISDDGVHFVKQGVVLPLGGASDWDASHGYGCSPVALDGRILLYCTGYGVGSYRIGLATSDDGVHFVKQGVVLPLGASGDFDDGRVFYHGAFVLDGRVYLYYSGFNGSKYRVGLAISDDGVHFVKQGVVLPLGADGDFDDGGGYRSFPVVVGGRVFLYYAGYSGAYYRIGLAISDDGVHFVKQGVVLPLGTSGDFDDGRIQGPGALVVGGRVFLYYAGHDGAKYRVGLAVSESGF